MRANNSERIKPNDVYWSILEKDPVRLIHFIIDSPARVRKIIEINSFSFLSQAFSMGTNQAIEVLLENGAKLDAVSKGKFVILEGVNRIITRQDLSLLWLMIRFAPGLLGSPTQNNGERTIASLVLGFFQSHDYLDQRRRELLNSSIEVSTLARQASYRLGKGDYEKVRPNVYNMMKRGKVRDWQHVERQVMPYVHCASSGGFFSR